MSAVYRIDVEPTHASDKTFGAWYGHVTRIADETYMSGSGCYGDTSEETVTKCQRWIAQEMARADGFSIYTTETGELVGAPEGHSARA